MWTWKYAEPGSEERIVVRRPRSADVGESIFVDGGREYRVTSCTATRDDAGTFSIEAVRAET